MILFLRLLFAHLLADFLFQPTSWVVDKNERKIRSVKLFYHIVVVTALSTFFTLDYFSWQIPVFIFVFHYLIDLIKIYFKPSISTNLTWFLFDQFLHLLLVFWISTLLDESLHAVSCEILRKLTKPDTFIYLISYFLIVWPSMVVVNLATKEWQKQITESGEPNLSNAGKWIGVLERLLVLTFVLGGQFQAIGFLIAAKSILRISVKSEENARIMSEYVLVGTLISFTIAVFVGIGARAILQL